MLRLLSSISYIAASILLILFAFSSSSLQLIFAVVFLALGILLQKLAKPAGR